MENANKPLLSICIPTFNRCDYLKKTLDSIVCQGPFLDGRVEIVISDNVSTDSTEELCNKYVNKYDGRIRYYKNEANIHNANFPLALSRGRGLLRKLSNDTQCYRPGSLDVICCLILRYSSTRPFIFFINSLIKPSKKNDIVPFSTFVERVSFYITYNVCFSFWEDDCEGIEKDISGVELFLWQTRKGLEIASRGNCLVIDDKLFDVQSPMKEYNSESLYNIFFNNFSLLLQPYYERKLLSKKSRKIIERKLILDFFFVWFVGLEKTNPSNKIFKDNYYKKLVINARCGNLTWLLFRLKYYYYRLRN